jgi:hypothetical protein
VMLALLWAAAAAAAEPRVIRTLRLPIDRRLPTW